METKIVWSERSVTNLQNIFDYISKDSAIYAARFINSLVLHTEEELQQYSEIGRRVPEFINTPLGHLREIIFKGYRVIYYPEYESNLVTIITVMSGRMSLEKAMK